MDKPYSDQPPAQQPQGATEPSSIPAPESPYSHGPSYLPNAAYSGYAGAQSIPLPGYTPSSGYQTGPLPHDEAPAPGSYSQNPPLIPYGQQSSGVLPPNVGYQTQATQKAQSNVIGQFIADAKLVLTRPAVASFDSIQSHASMGPVLLGLVIIGGAYAIAGSILNPAAGLFGGLIGTFLGFFISTGVAMLIAKTFGGIGKFKTYAYAIAVFDVPLGIADAASLLVPPISALIFLLGIVYGGVLGVLATSSVHRLSVGKSVLVYLVSLTMKVAIPLCALATVAIVLIYWLAGQH